MAQEKLFWGKCFFTQTNSSIHFAFPVYINLDYLSSIYPTGMQVSSGINYVQKVSQSFVIRQAVLEPDNYVPGGNHTKL